MEAVLRFRLGSLHMVAALTDSVNPDEPNLRTLVSKDGSVIREDSNSRGGSK